MRKPNTECKKCKKKIYKRPWELEKSNNILYCSKKCYGESISKTSPCIVCGILIRSGRNRKTCSDECFSKYEKGRKKNNSSKTNTLSFRKYLLEKRNKTCEICGFNKWNIFNIHHITEVSNGGTDDEINLLVLCPNCHTAIHKGFIENNGKKVE